MFQLNMLLFVSAVFIAFYLPGRLLLAAWGTAARPSGARDRRTFDPERVFFTISAGIVTAGFSGQMLVAAGIFSLPALLISVYGIAGISLVLRRKHVDKNRLFNWVEPAVVPIAVWLFLCLLGKPYEWIAAGGWDAGNYNNIAAQIVHTGGVLDTDLPHRLFGEFIGPGQWQPTISNLYQKEDGVIYPRYFHLFSVYLAIFERFSGTYASQYINGFFGLATLLSFFLLARQMGVGGRLSLFGTALLAFTGIEYHYFREVYSELCGQYFLFAAFVSLIVGLRQNRNAAVALAACLFSGLLLVKMDAVLIWQFYIIIAMGVLLVSRMDKAFAARLFGFTALLLPLFALTFLYAWGFTRPYVFQVMQKMQTSLGLRMPRETFLAVYTGTVLLALLITAGTALILYRFPTGRVGRLLAAVRRITASPGMHRALKIAGTVAVGGASIYLFFLRPSGYAAAVAAGNPDAYKLISSIRLLYIFAPFVIAVFLIGAGILLVSRIDRTRSFAVLLPLFVFFYYMMDISHQDLQVIWTYRRLVPPAVPYILLCVTVFIDALVVQSQKTDGSRKRIYQGAAILTAVLSAALTAVHLKPFRSYTENEGLYDKMREIAAEIPADAPLLMERGPESDKFCSTLHFVFRKQCVILRDPHFSSVLKKALRANGEALLAQLSKERSKEIREHYRLEMLREWRFTTPWLLGDQTLPEGPALKLLYPNRFIQIERGHRFRLFRVTPK